MGGYRDWDDGDWPPARPRRVEGGIKARSRRGQIGESWWSGRFVAILESLGMGPRLGRGRAYARAGQVLDLGVTAGTVSARVQGSRARPYRVSIGLGRFGEADWARVESALAARALYSAKLLAGEMPLQIEEVFSSCGLSLFPERAQDLAMSCSCPDWAVPCKHIAATSSPGCAPCVRSPAPTPFPIPRSDPARLTASALPSRTHPWPSSSTASGRPAGTSRPPERPRPRPWLPTCWCASSTRLPSSCGVATSARCWPPPTTPWRRPCAVARKPKRRDEAAHALVGGIGDTAPSPDRGNHQSTPENR